MAVDENKIHFVVNLLHLWWYMFMFNHGWRHLFFLNKTFRKKEYRPHFSCEHQSQWQNSRMFKNHNHTLWDLSFFNQSILRQIYLELWFRIWSVLQARRKQQRENSAENAVHCTHHACSQIKLVRKKTITCSINIYWCMRQQTSWRTCFQWKLKNVPLNCEIDFWWIYHSVRCAAGLLHRKNIFLHNSCIVFYFWQLTDAERTPQT